MAGRLHHRVIANNFHRSDVIDHAKRNGVQWETNNHEGVNWMRASTAIVHHINNGGDFHTEHTDVETAKKMLHHYESLRELHKKDMVPHIRSTVAKLYHESADKHIPNEELVDKAHEHLEANGGHIWSAKMHTLRHLNTSINKLRDTIDRHN
ncbi:hypothetical protein EalM132_00047 [Exiguobacterium phage vB_EalM-132]|nr:hypothetical protein EalM132_00047 [Exiguobacterium phage vB_EalM-132]